MVFNGIRFAKWGVDKENDNVLYEQSLCHNLACTGSKCDEGLTTRSGMTSHISEAIAIQRDYLLANISLEQLIHIIQAPLNSEQALWCQVPKQGPVNDSTTAEQTRMPTKLHLLNTQVVVQFCVDLCWLWAPSVCCMSCDLPVPHRHVLRA